MSATAPASLSDCAAHRVMLDELRHWLGAATAGGHSSAPLAILAASAAAVSDRLDRQVHFLIWGKN